MKRVGRRFALLGLLLALSLTFLIPTYQPLYRALPSWVKKVLPDRGVVLGLDLQGGIHLVLEVEEDRAVEMMVERSVR
ncbi:MAG: protein translocase subunit SecD, partial [Nitrospiraceae bacterium]